MKSLDFTGIAYLAGLALVAALAWQVVRRGKTIAGAAGSVAAAVNPANPENVVNKAVTGVVRAVTGDESATLGTKIWEWTHRDQVEAERALTSSSAPPASTAFNDALASAWEDATAQAAIDNAILGEPKGAVFGVYPKVK